MHPETLTRPAAAPAAVPAAMRGDSPPAAAARGAGAPWPALLLGLLLSASQALAQQEAESTDLLTFAAGTLPAGEGGDAEAMRVRHAQVLGVIDGNPKGFLLTPRPGGADYTVTLTYELPAPTRFTHFEVPNVRETPSPSQTFVGRLVVLGSSESATAGFEPLGEVALTLHEERNQVTRFEATSDASVRWVKVEFSGGLDVQVDKTFYEFSELRGYGEQAPVPMSEQFTGRWRDRGVRLELAQDGNLVSGCYDDDGELSGAVSGRTLFASGVSTSDGVQSSFVLTVAEDGSVRGLRSTNGAPFYPYDGASSDQPVIADCAVIEAPVLGCDAIVYGLKFAFDSAQLLPESGDTLAALVAGLGASAAEVIVVEGHSSSEGDEAYNLELSQRRAEAVVAALVAAGLDGARLSAQGFGEGRPLASNDDEAGRALNRRVEVRCGAG